MLFGVKLTFVEIFQVLARLWQNSEAAFDSRWLTKRPKRQKSAQTGCQRCWVCSNERVKPENQKEPFSKLVSYDSTNKNEGPPSDEDIRTGYKLFHAVVYCPPARVIKLFRFVNQLLSRESSRTIIQTFVNLFQTGNKMDFAMFSLAKQFYHVLASTLNLQYGNVLLATSSKAQLQAAIRNDQPFFVNNSDQVEKCLKESQCDELQNKLQTLGIVLSKASHIFCNASLFQMATEFHKSCLSTQSTWLQTRKAICLLLHLSPSAPTRETATCWDMQDLNLRMWQSVTSFDQPSWKASFATHWILQNLWRNRQNLNKKMDFFFYWTPNLTNWTPLIWMWRPPRGEKILSRFSSRHLLSTQHLDMDLMGWVPWRAWPEQKALSNFLTTRRNAVFTTERNARLRRTWIKFRESANVFPGLFRLVRAHIRWKESLWNHAIL